MEAYLSSACGCRVITDLPSDEILPEIDGNLVRVHPEISLLEMKDLINSLVSSYDEERQREYARLAQARYDYRVEGRRLADAIEKMRLNYRS